jgi:predicted TIM-barrel fold metal-dependent hydrolase
MLDLHEPAGGPTFRRRDLAWFASALGVGLLAACRDRGSAAVATPAGGRAAVPMLRVDAHCHLFNASDLPGQRFVQRVVLEDAERQVVLGGDPARSRAAIPALAGLLARILGSGAPTAEAELRAIERNEYVVAASSARAAGPSDDVELVRRALAEELRSDPGPGRAATDVPDPASRQALQELLARETGFSIEEPGRATQVPYAAEARALLAGGSRSSYLVRWAVLLIRSRREIVDRYLQLYGGEDGVDLFTPAMIDFSSWLDGEDPASSLESQIRVVERLQRLHDRPAMHAIVAFDPWRQVRYGFDRKGSDPLGLVRWAVEEMGFVGVKLYPPMGFLPLGNATASQPYPQRARRMEEEIRRRTPGFSFPAGLDRALVDLYGWCEAEGVPVLAHASRSNGAARGYSDRADPAGWRPVLRRFPELRVSLAHFGGFEEGAAGGLEGSWEEHVGQLLAEGDSGLFADLSYFGEVLPGAVPAERQAEVRRLLGEFLRSYDPDARHLVYGSDWVMLGVEPGHERYLAIVEDALTPLMNPAAVQRCMGLNAGRWLGLDAGGKSRARVTAYRKKHGLDTDWLMRFDAS